MSSVTPSEMVIRRMRALGKIPPGVPARLDRGGRNRGMTSGDKVLWQLTACGTGEPLGIASRFTARDLAQSRAWRFRELDGITYVEPGDRAPIDRPGGP